MSNYEKIIMDIENKLSGNMEKDMIILKEESIKYSNHENKEEISKAIGQLALRVLNNKDRLSEEEMNNRKAIITNNLNKSYKLVEEGQLNEAKLLLEEAIEAIPYKSKGGKTQFSFESALELWTYMIVFKPQIQIYNTTTDNSSVYKLYGDVQAKMNNISEALKSYELSLVWDPIRSDTIIAIADIKKMEWKYEEYNNLIKNAIVFSKTKLELGRCYYSLANYYVSIKDYEKSVIFYHLSNKYVNNTEVYLELNKLSSNYNVNIEEPNEDKIKEVLNKLEIPIGPSQLIIDSIKSLANESKKNNSLQVYRFCKDVYYKLTDKELQ